MYSMETNTQPFFVFSLKNEICVYFLFSLSYLCMYFILFLGIFTFSSFLFCLIWYAGGAGADDEPEFSEPIENITVPAGREVKLACSVKSLGPHKVSSQNEKTSIPIYSIFQRNKIHQQIFRLHHLKN